MTNWTHREIKNAQKTKNYFLPQHIKPENGTHSGFWQESGDEWALCFCCGWWGTTRNKKHDCLLRWHHPSVVISTKGGCRNVPSRRPHQRVSAKPLGLFILINEGCQRPNSTARTLSQLQPLPCVSPVFSHRAKHQVTYTQCYSQCNYKWEDWRKGGKL